MVIRLARFNIYLALPLLLLFAGCQSQERKRAQQPSTLRIHLETNLDGTDRSEEVSLFRTESVKMVIEKASFLNEGFIKEAKVVDAIGGLALRIQLDHKGTLLLDQYTTANRGKHMAIYSQFVLPPDEKLNRGRWIAAPVIANRITDGVLLFTPDVTPEEADQIVRGLNNVAEKAQSSLK